MNKVKVLVTIPSAFCFGLQYVSLDLFGAASNRIDPHFFLTRWNDGVFEKVLKDYGFEYSFSWMGMFSRKLDWKNLKMSLITLSKLPRLYYDFIKINRKLKPDLLFFANHHELILLMPVLIFINKKVVCHMHDPSPPVLFQKINFLLYGLRVDYFIVISKDVKKRLMDLGCSEKKITVIHNGIHLPKGIEGIKSSLFIKKFGWTSDVFVVGLTGQMTEVKGHQDLVEAIAIAVKHNPKLRLVIGGQPLEPFYGILKNQISSLGLNEIVQFSGWVENVGDFYSSIDLLVLASRHDEGYGLVVAEMMSFAKPVVITSSGGATEIVEDGVSGFIVPKRDPASMAEKIVRLSNDKEIYEIMSANARTRIVDNFTIQVSAEKFMNMIHSIKMGAV